MKNEQELREVLGKNVRARRKSRGWSLEKLGELVGISRNSISEIELAKNFANPDTLVNLARVLETEVYELLKPDNVKPDKAKDKIAKFSEEVREAGMRYLSDNEG